MVWTNGMDTVVDVGEHWRSFTLFAPLLEDASLWPAVEVDPEFGYHVAWHPPHGDMPLEIPAPVLWRLHLEQTGEAMSPASFTRWMDAHGLSMTRTAQVLGISRRMVGYYRSGERIIPKYIRLACLGAERELRS